MNIKDIGIIIFVCILWGLDFVFSKDALDVLNPLLFTAFRFSIVGIGLMFFIKKRIPPDILYIFFAGFMLVVLNYSANDAANKLNNNTMVSGTIGQFDTILAIFMGYFIFKEKLTKRALIGIMFVIIGLISMITFNIINAEIQNSIKDNRSIDFSNLLSIIIAVFGITGWSGYIFFTKKLENKMTNIEIIAWSSIIGSFMLFIINLLFFGKEELIKNINMIDLRILARIIYSGLFGILVPNLLLHILLRNYEISKLNTFVLLVPVITIIGTIIF